MQYAVFDEITGLPLAFYDERFSGSPERPIYGEAPKATEENPNPVPPLIGYEKNPDCKIPDNAIKLTAEQYVEFMNNSGLRKWENGKVVEYVLPEIEPIIIIPSVILWERMTNEEAEQVNAAMETQPFRTRQIFLTANTFRSDHELWPLLQDIATNLFGAERATQLLKDGANA